MKKILLLLSVIGLTMVVNAVNEPAIIASTDGANFEYVRLTSNAVITIDNSGATPIFKVNSTEASGTCIMFASHDFSDMISSIATENSEKEIEKVTIYSVSGVKLVEPQRGLNVVVITYTDKTTSTAKVLKQ